MRTRLLMFECSIKLTLCLGELRSKAFQLSLCAIRIAELDTIVSVFGLSGVHV